MAVKIIDKRFPSSDKTNTLKGRVFLPEGEPIGFVHIVHGMTEHIRRYERFMTDLAESGYVCFGFDNLGHGESAKQEDLGFIASREGWKYLCTDVFEFGPAVKREYADACDYTLLGHSMGSFIVRAAANMFPFPDRLIIMGTGGKNPATDIGLLVLRLIRSIKGERHVSPFADSLAFGSYNNRFEKDRKYAWLTKNTEIQDIYSKDKFCTFHFTISAMIDLIYLNKLANDKSWFKNIRKDMPILLVSGADDPVGDYSKGVLWVDKTLKACGANVQTHLYENCRHEILNEDCYDTLFGDILNFVK